MSTYNSYFDDRTRTTISQAIDTDGTYCVLFQRGSQSEVRRCTGPAEQAAVFQSNVKWYRGY